MSTEDKYPNWFAVTAQENFEKHLRPLAGQPGLNFLQLGAYTGDASEWLLDNILGGVASKLTDVDTWEGSDEEVHKSIDFKDVYKVYCKKVNRFIKRERKVYWHAQTTTDFLTHANGCCDCGLYQYDFIYVDADHTTVGVLLDGELSWPQLKSGGIMAFDDYEWGSNLPLHLRPKPGIDLFMLRHEGEYELLTKNQQVGIKKK